jgi:hypothetical protein
MSINSINSFKEAMLPEITLDPAQQKKALLQRGEDESGGLEGMLSLAIGDPVILRTNILPKIGLVTNARRACQNQLVLSSSSNSSSSFSDEAIQIIFVYFPELRFSNTL